MTLRAIAPYPVPPRKKKKHNDCITLKFALKGWIPSKKNIQMPVINKHDKKWKFKLFIAKLYQECNNDKDRMKRLIEYVNDMISNTRAYITHPSKFQQWEDEAFTEIQNQCHYWLSKYKHKNLSFPITKCTISIYHYWADDMNRDNSNKMETINDLLVRAGVIMDDNYKCISKVESEAECYKGEITTHVTLIYVTAYEW